MPKVATVNISLPKLQLRRLDRLVRTHGYASRSEWFRELIRRMSEAELEESPRMSPDEIIRRMRQAGRYSARFLRELEAGLRYADQTR